MADAKPPTAIRVETRYFPRNGPSLPALVLQATCLVDSYMLWIGATEEPEENARLVPLQGNLARDWACAMPPIKNLPVAGTSLFRSSSSDVALAIAQRLAHRFKKQVFLSVDIPQSVGRGPQILLEAEKALVQTLKQLEGLEGEQRE
ncbi:hypothetical protein BV25DRAFT_1833367 [Artomyces pyxidatus]|uniref:Uncharacterized protein n=1 Tax=Artomyces pyxidatus TaxID=48021 RepID=A0ACB8SF88_9AGAM|nr:hypothetical protein BV25DRAFT_1833367 [Artomyces pyxidatus]